jgi:hypothetical protein
MAGDRFYLHFGFQLTGELDDDDRCVAAIDR